MPAAPVQKGNGYQIHCTESNLASGWAHPEKTKKKMTELSLNGELEFLEHHGETFALKYLAQSCF